MSSVATGPQRPETMTPRQLDRRRRVLDAVHALLTERPLAEIQVKDIADRAQVSLAAIYRYFASKDHLLTEALVDWAEEGGRAYERRPPVGTMSEQLVAIVRRGLRAYRKSPQYAAVLLEVTGTRDPYAIETWGRLSKLVDGGMLTVLEPLDDDVATKVRRTIGLAWVGGLFDCVHGRSTYADLEETMVAACRLLVEPLEA